MKFEKWTRRLNLKKTGRSKGQAVIINKDSKAMAIELAATWHWYSWAGIDIGTEQGRFLKGPFGIRDRI